MNNPDVDAFLRYLGLRQASQTENTNSVYDAHSVDDGISSTAANNNPRADHEELINKLMNVAMQCLGTIRLLVIEQEKIEVAKYVTHTEHFQSPGDVVEIDGDSESKIRRETSIQSYTMAKAGLREVFGAAVKSMAESIIHSRDLEVNDPLFNLCQSFPWEQSIASSGWCMLHWATLHEHASIESPDISQSHMDKISQIVTTYPVSSEELDGEGHTYMYYAMMHNSLPLIKFVANLTPQLFKCKDGNGKTILHYCARLTRNPEVLHYCLSLFPSNEFIYQFAIDDDSNMLLHEAARGIGSLEIVRELMFLFPEATKHFNRDGLLPLHLSMQCSDVELVKVIFGAYPEAISVRDANGWLPIHHAAYYSRSIDVIQWIAKISPGGFTIPQQPSGRLPLHYAAAKCRSLKVLRFIYDSYPEAVSIFDTNRRLPLHNIIARCDFMSPARFKGFKLLLDAYPDAVLMSGDDGRTPYDLAIRDNLGDLILYLMLRLHPELDNINYEILKDRLDPDPEESLIESLNLLPEPADDIIIDLPNAIPDPLLASK